MDHCLDVVHVCPSVVHALKASSFIFSMAVWEKVEPFKAKLTAGTLVIEVTALETINIFLVGFQLVSAIRSYYKEQRWPFPTLASRLPL